MMNLNIYNTNFSRLSKWLLPTFLRKTIFVAWISVFLTPIKTFAENKKKYRNNVRYKLAHNGQVIYLEKVLNEYYDIAGYSPYDHQNTKKIYIGKGERIFPLYIYTKQEQKKKYIYTKSEQKPTYIYSKAEIEQVYADFIVWVPATTSYIEAGIRALIDYYLDTRIYKIKTY